MPLHTLVLTLLTTHPLLTLSLAILLPLTSYLLHTLYLTPLSLIPGPFKRKLTPLYLLYHAYHGTECRALHTLHQQYGPIIRTGPSSVHISSSSALPEIYSPKHTFLKPAFYRNFDLDGHTTIFSATDPEYRNVRAKAVKALFATAAIRRDGDVLEGCCRGFIERLEREKTRARNRGGVVDVLNLARCLAVDTVTAYLFGVCYGGCEEDLTLQRDNDEISNRADEENKEGPKLSASEMVNSFVAVGRFWYLPPWLFGPILWLSAKIYPDPAADASIARIDEFLWSLISSSTSTHTATDTDTDTVTDTKPATNPSQTSDSKPAQTYQSLLTSHIPQSEIHAQCKDLIFAGTDSIATVLATILFNLSLHPSIHRTLLAELQSDPNNALDPQTQPYLRGVVREGLRLAMPNPSRLPRVVPPQGWGFGGYEIPGGTVVGCSSYELHFDEGVWEEAWRFWPDRWIGDGSKEEMEKVFTPFGLGSRQCIARNLATAELFIAVREVVRSGILEGSRPVKDKIEILEWFNSRIVGEKIELQWL